jgi:hypothetical protein
MGLILPPAAFVIVVSEPGRNLVARAFEEAALIVAAKPVVSPAPTFTARSFPRIVTVICHDNSPYASAGRPEAGRCDKKNERAFEPVPL